VICSAEVLSPVNPATESSSGIEDGIKVLFHPTFWAIDGKCDGTRASFHAILRAKVVVVPLDKSYLKLISHTRQANRLAVIAGVEAKCPAAPNFMYIDVSVRKNLWDQIFQTRPW